MNLKQVVRLKPGERLEVELAGGAGYGDLRRRDRERVVDDLKDHKISVEAARELYGFGE